MNFLQKYKFLLILVLTLLFAGAGFYLDRTLNKQADALTKEINARTEKLKGYYSNIEKAPSPNLLSRLTRDKITLEGNYESVSSRFALVPVLTLPEGEIFPALYYKETMYLVLDDLRRQSANKSIALSSLGITETGLPPAEHVPGLLVLLDTVKRLGEEVFRSKISSLDSVQIGTPSASPFYIEIPLAITVTGSSSRLAYFFENLGSSQTIFVLENMAMVRGGGGGGAAAAAPVVPGGPALAPMPGGPAPVMQAAAPVAAGDAGDNFQASLSLKRIIWGKDLIEKIKLVALPAATTPGMAGPPGMPGGMPGGPPMPPGAAPAPPQPPSGLQRPAVPE